jgi:hypothetical protein
MHFYSPLIGNFWLHDFDDRIDRSPMADHAPEIESPCPQDIKQLQWFLGMASFYRRFLPNCAQVLRPLTNLLKGGPKTLEWTAPA